MIRLYAAIVCAALAATARAQSPAAERPRPAGPSSGHLAQVSTKSPFPAGCNGAQTGTLYENGPVEPLVAVDPSDAAHLVGVWQQDRWSNGGANGVLAAVTRDAGRTWNIAQPKFSVCAGGTYERASDPWVAIAPDGTVHYVALSLNGAGAVTAVLVSRSTDGGSTWSDPITLDKPPAGSDKESIAADPADANYVYVIWDQTNLGNRIPAWFARSTDGGATWEASRVIYNPGVNGFASGHQLVVLPNGMLVDIFALSFESGSGQQPGDWVAAMRSQDHGVSWSAPVVVSTNGTVGTVDAKTQLALRTGAGIPSAAVDPVSGAIYVVWPDARFSGGARDGVALSKSLDGGVTWSDPVQVNQAPNVQAFTPVVAAGAGGKLAVTYYDFREDTDATGTLFANAWRITSLDGGATWNETPLAGPFDMLSAPRATGPFLGDYQGLAAAGEGFLAFFVAANTGDAASPSSVIASSLVRPPDRRNNLRTEVNLRPRRPPHGDVPEPKERVKKARHR